MRQRRLLVLALGALLAACAAPGPATPPTAAGAAAGGPAVAGSPAAPGTLGPATPSPAPVVAGAATYGAVAIADAPLAAYRLTGGAAIATGRTDAAGRFALAIPGLAAGTPLEVVAYRDGHVVVGLAVAGDPAPIALDQAGTLAMGAFADTYRDLGEAMAGRDPATFAAGVGTLRAAYVDVAARNARQLAAAPADSPAAGPTGPAPRADGVPPSLIAALHPGVRRLKADLGVDHAVPRHRALLQGPPAAFDPHLFLAIFQAAYHQHARPIFADSPAEDVLARLAAALEAPTGAAAPTAQATVVADFAATYGLGVMFGASPDAAPVATRQIGVLLFRQYYDAEAGTATLLVDLAASITTPPAPTAAPTEEPPAGDPPPVTSGGDGGATDDEEPVPEPTPTPTPTPTPSVAAAGAVTARDGVLTPPDGPEVLGFGPAPR